MSAAPKCSYFGVCGGCVYQDRPYSEQLELKRKLVEETLTNGKKIAVLPTIPSPKPYHYRSTISLTVKKREGVLKFGFTGQNGRGFIPIDSCAIADERLNQYLPEALRRLNELPEKRRYHTSQIALRAGDGEAIATTLREDRGKTLECTVEGKRFSYAISSFFQHNVSVLGALTDSVRTLLAPAGEETLFDLYSGVGLFSVLLTPFYKKVIGIEEGYEAVKHAKLNAERNGVTNIDFLEGKVEAQVRKIKAKKKTACHVIVDPPRAGLKPEVIKAISKLKGLEKLVYVSCSLESLKRDLELFAKKFQITAVQPIDLFPQTKHIETIVLLVAGGAANRARVRPQAETA